MLYIMTVHGNCTDCKYDNIFPIPIICTHCNQLVTSSDTNYYQPANPREMIFVPQDEYERLVIELEWYKKNCKCDC